MAKSNNKTSKKSPFIKLELGKTLQAVFSHFQINPEHGKFPKSMLMVFKDGSLFQLTTDLINKVKTLEKPIKPGSKIRITYLDNVPTNFKAPFKVFELVIDGKTIEGTKSFKPATQDEVNDFLEQF